MPKISVIIPVYGVEKYLRECLDSVLAQTLKDIEIICIDDGGKDDCPQILDEYASKDNRIKVIHKENGGYGKAMNVGLDNATGEYIGIVEPDDYIKSNMYEDLYNLATQNNSDIVKSCFYKKMDNEDDSREYKMKWTKRYNIPSVPFTLKECPYFLYWHPSIWSAIYKSSFLKENNIRFKEAPGAGWTDNPFQVQTMCLAKNIVYTNEAYYYWRCVNLSETDDLKDYTIPFKRSDEIHQWLEEYNINDKNILESLYRRELAYIHIVLNSQHTKDKKGCYEQILKMCNRMDTSIVYASKYLPLREKIFVYLCKRKPACAVLFLKMNNFRKRLVSCRLNRHEISLRILCFNIIRLYLDEKEPPQYDVGILGFWFGENYGSVLTYFALNRVLQDMGKSVIMIEKPTNSVNDLELNSLKHSRRFAKKYYKISNYRDFSRLPELNNLCSTFMLGSDQVFNPGCYRGFKNALFFDFANPDKKLIAYASSFGHVKLKFPKIEKLRLNYFLSKFSGISVRESSGLQLLKKLNLKGEQVLDPIFLCDTKHYENLIADNIPYNTDKNYVLSYILDPNEKKRELIQSVSKYFQKPYKNILDGIECKYQKNKDLLNLENTIEPTNLPNVLAQYKNCDFVITDSFHGTCMAILFRKPFIAIANRHRGVTRFESLLNLLSLKNRLVYDVNKSINNTQLLEDIDYNKVYECLNIEKEKSFHWLEDMLNKPLKLRHEGLKDIIIKSSLAFHDKHEKFFRTFTYYRYKMKSVLLLSPQKRQYYKEKARKYAK